ncbi:uncharacterized protein LOC125460939 [Stegostoma tigrinum]|uniref:uncharacterized protein LOC125460939 n=1 Tax=Stegostoma tigrinum TaxID=3053191 RepID=UPI00286FE816|nr:uncharacterized protein LOC125460939 [Stegostoma tigrinum]
MEPPLLSPHVWENSNDEIDPGNNITVTLTLTAAGKAGALTKRDSCVLLRHKKRKFTDMRLGTVLLLIALIYIDAAGTASIRNSANRMNEKKIQTLRHHLSDSNNQMKFYPRPMPFPEKNAELRYALSFPENNPEVPLTHPIALPENNNARAPYPHSSPLPEGNTVANYPYLIPLPKSNLESSYYRTHPFHSQNKPTLAQDFPRTYLVASAHKFPMKGNVIIPENRPYPHPYPQPYPFLNKNKLLPFTYPEVQTYPSSERESEVEPSHSPENVTEMETQPSLEDELEQEVDSSSEDDAEKDVLVPSEIEMQKKPSPATISPHVNQASCLPGWIFNSKLSICYSIFQGKMTWIQAEVSCQMYARGAHLVSIHGDEQNQFIQGLIKQKNPVQPSMWIGLSDCHKEGIYLWTDGSVLDFTKWSIDQPNDESDSENCVSVNSEGIEGKWHERVCSDELPFICSYKLF